MSYFEIRELNSDIDIFLFNVSKKIVPKLPKTLNESDIYSMSLVLKVLASLCIYLNIKVLPGLLFFISYFTSILYHSYIQTLKRHDYVNNNFWDLVTYSLILFRVYNKNKKMFTFLFILTLITVINWGCKATYVKQYHSQFDNFSYFNNICTLLCQNSNIRNFYNKYNLKLGNGTLVSIISIYLMFI